MSLIRRAQRQDGNAAELVKLARQLGMLIWYIASPVDLLVGHAGEWHLVEIKGKSGTYTPAQKEFIEEADAASLPVLTWRTEADVLKMLD